MLKTSDFVDKAIKKLNFIEAFYFKNRTGKVTEAQVLKEIVFFYIFDKYTLGKLI